MEIFVKQATRPECFHGRETWCTVFGAGVLVASGRSADGRLQAVKALSHFVFFVQSFLAQDAASDMPMAPTHRHGSWKMQRWALGRDGGMFWGFSATHMPFTAACACLEGIS